MKTLIALVSSCLWLVAPHAFAVDTAAPQLTSIDIAPDQVDVSAASQQITLTLAITDDASGFTYCDVNLYSQAGNYITSTYLLAEEHRVSGDALNGSYTRTVTVPRYAPPGTWKLRALLYDRADNSRLLGDFGEPFPVPADATFTVVNSGQVDVSAPVLTTSTVTPATVNTAGADQQVKVSFACTDDLAGLRYGFVQVWDPGGTLRYDLNQFFSPGAPLSGDKMAGTYEVMVPLARGSAPGAWTMQIYMLDEVGNQVYSAIDGFTVANGTERAGTLATALDAVQLPWTTSTPGWIHQTGTTHDGLDAAASPPLGDGQESTLQTTVTGPGVLSFQWQVDSEADADFLSVEVVDTLPPQKISGNTPWAGVALTIPAGLHTILWKYAKNGAVASGADRGWLDEVRFIADEDAAPPALQELRISPNWLSVVDGPQSVQFSVEFTDDHHGLTDGMIYLFSPSGMEYTNIALDETSLVQGDLHGGTFEVTFDFPQGSEFGAWRVELDLTEAVTANSRRYGASGVPFPTPGEELFTVWNGISGDSEAPQIQELAISPTEVDVSTDAATTTVTLRITDGLAGFQYGSVSVFTPAGAWTGATYFSAAQRLTGNSVDGIYEVVVPVPRYGPPGTWRVQCDIWDAKQNGRYYPSNTPYPVGVDDSFTVVNSGQTDLLAPTLSSINITPAAIDTGAGPVTLEVTVSISDDLSGIRDATLYFHHPQHADSPVPPKALGDSTRISGDALSSTHQVSVTVPQGVAPGTWTIRVYLRDMVGLTRYYGLDGAAYPEPGDGEFTVIAGTDTLAPKITELSITPATVDVSGGPATVTVTARITDFQTGFTEGNFDVITPTGELTGSTYFTAGHRVSGDVFDGVYAIELPVPSYGPPGVWSVSCYLVDGAGNGRAYPSGTAFPAGAQETFTVENTGQVDLLAPVVTSITVTPGTVATPGNLAVTVAISDDVSGIRDAQLYFYDPLNVSNGPTVLDASHLTSGDAVNGTYLVNVALPPGLVAGTWTVGVFLRDLVGRTRFYNPEGEAYTGSGDGKFTVDSAPVSTFKAFAASFNLTGNDSLPAADPDHDGRNNAVELMLGSNPTLPNAGPGVFTLNRDATHLHLDFTCAPGLTVTVNGNHLELRDGGGGAPLWLTGQTQFGLAGPWTTVLPTHVADNTWRISLALAAGRGFARLTFEDP